MATWVWALTKTGDGKVIGTINDFGSLCGFCANISNLSVLDANGICLTIIFIQDFSVLDDYIIRHAAKRLLSSKIFNMETADSACCFMAMTGRHNRVVIRNKSVHGGGNLLAVFCHHGGYFFMG